MEGTLQGIGTILAFIAFLSICWWAFSKHKKQDFEEAAQLPFAEDEDSLQNPLISKNNGDSKNTDRPTTPQNIQ